MAADKVLFGFLSRGLNCLESVDSFISAGSPDDYEVFVTITNEANLEMQFSGEIYLSVKTNTNTGQETLNSLSQYVYSKLH